MGRNTEMHVVAMIGAVVLSTALAIPTLIFVGNASAKADNEPKFEDKVVIEASIAYSSAPKVQPQKAFRPPDPEPVKEPGRIENPDTPPPPEKKLEKKPDKPKRDKDKPKKPPDRTHLIDDTAPVGETKPRVGPKSNNDKGFASETKGDPFFQELARELHDNFEFPSILSTETKTVPMGCLYLTPDGKIEKWRLDVHSGDPKVDDAVERALRAVEKLRNENPKEISKTAFNQATQKWTCFPFNP